MYDRLRAWFETFQSDSYTENVVSALVDCAETLWQAEDRGKHPLGEDAVVSLSLLDSALQDEEIVR